MSLEAPGFITSLVPTNPTPTDPKSQGDDHLRLIKQDLLASFPAIDAAMLLTSAELNALPGQVAAKAAVGSALPLAPGTAAAGVSALASRQDHVHPGGVAAGQVVAMVPSYDAGSNTGATSLAGLTQASRVYTPVYAGSTILVEVAFQASVAYAAGQNGQANYQVMKNGVGDSYISNMASPSNAGGIGAVNPCFIRHRVLTPPQGVALAFTLGGFVSNGGGNITATNQEWCITEIKG